jgi:hypothetical protein
VAVNLGRSGNREKKGAGTTLTMSFIFAVTIRLYIAAARAPPRSERKHPASTAGPSS